MPIISDPIIPLGQRILASSAIYRRNRVLYDYAIGDLAFLVANSKDYPYSRATSPFRKEQFDSSANPGEQTLTQWWIRSQSSFHSGEGIKFQEPASDEEVMSSFAESRGVDVWTPGQASLLRDTTLKNASTVDTLVMGAIDGTTDIFFQAEAAVLTRETAGASAAVTWGGAASIVSLATDGTNYLAASSVGIYRGTLAGGAGALLWNTGSTNTVIGWTKQRLVAGIGASVYELVGGAPPTLPTALYTHPTSGWRWTSIAEGPSAIFLAGYGGSESAIYKFVLSTAGVMPAMTSGIVACRLPYGEQVHSIESYLGVFIAIGTNKGVRIGIVATNGDISYGPLVIESTQPVLDMVGRDRFIYATCTNQIATKSGLWRIDLGNELEDGSFAYATDLQSGVTGVVNSVTNFGTSGQMVFGVSGAGSYLEHATQKIAVGTLRTGYVRFNTLEPKQYRYVSARTLDASGTVAIETYDRSGVAVSVISITDYDQSDFNLNRNASEEYLGLRFTLNRDTDVTLGPTLQSWQIKALPAVARSRIIRVPILLFENMRDSKGAALPPVDVSAVLSAMETYEDASAPILFTDLCHQPNRSELVVVDEVQFQKISPPSNCTGDGGIVMLTLRTVQ